MVKEKQLDLDELIESDKIEDELDYERALMADRKLRVLSKKDPTYKSIRIKLRNSIETWESNHWPANAEISEEKIQDSDLAEEIAEKERMFIEKRKKRIKEKLKQMNLTQQDLGVILGHESKSYMSELINGINPFTLKDLVVINRLLKVELTDLIPTFLSNEERLSLKTSIEKINNRKIKLHKDDLATA